MMRRALWIALLALAAFAPFAVAEEAKDAPSLDGTWKVTALSSGGEVAPDDVFKTWRWEFKGKKLVISAENEEPIEITAVIDSTKSPATIDMKAVSGPTKDKTVKGIYELKEGKLRVCLGDFDTEGRPAEFDGGKGKGLISLERVKGGGEK